MSAASQTQVVWSATPTPFLNDGELDTGALERVVEQHLRLDVGGLFLGGTCGEGPFMPNGQRAELVRATRRVAGDRLKLAAQVSDTSAARVQENMARARDAGADYVVIAPPWLEWFASRDFLRRYFLESIEAAALPVGIYVRATGEDSPLNLSLWKELATHPAVRVIKDSSGSGSYREAFAAIRRERSDLLLLTGDEFNAVAARAGGYDGALLGTGILISGMIRRALSAVTRGEKTAAEQWQTRSNQFLYDLFGQDLGRWLGGLKYALRQLGIFSTEFMHLSFPLSDAGRKQIDAALERERELIRPAPTGDGQ